MRYIIFKSNERQNSNFNKQIDNFFIIAQVQKCIWALLIFVEKYLSILYVLGVVMTIPFFTLLKHDNIILFEVPAHPHRHVDTIKLNTG